MADASRETDPHLEDLVQRAIDAYEAGGAEAVDNLLARYEEDRRDVEDALRNLRGMGLLAEPTGGAPPLRSIAGFRLLERIGTGGAGSVWLAEQDAVDRRVAIKLLHPLQQADPTSRRRFEREARALARVRHDHIVDVLDVSEHEGVPYLAMAFVDGTSLDELVVDAHARGEPPEPRRIARWGAELADALHAVHAADLVHRDVKPGNVRITPDDRAVLLDFGLALDERAATLTRTGAFHGSPHFCSPEHVSDAHTVGPLADQFSLGATLHFAWTGTFPFAGSTPEAVLRNILTTEPAALRSTRPETSRDAEAVLARALEKIPSRRYADASAFAADLRALADERPVAARPAGPLRRALKWARRRPVAAAAFVATALTLTVLAAVLWISLDALEIERRAVSERDTALGDLRAERSRRELDLAALTLRDLPRQAELLWPARPSRIGGADGMDAWLERADALLAAAESYRRERVELETDLEASGVDLDAVTAELERSLTRFTETLERIGDKTDDHSNARRAWVLDRQSAAHARIRQRRIAAIPDRETARRWANLEAVVRELDGLAAVRDRIAKRRRYALDVERLTVDEPAEGWRAAIAGIRRDARFDGAELEPIVGFVPLGPDPGTGLQEFVFLDSGTVPDRIGPDGTLELADEHGIVFVLVPPGRFVMGSSDPAEDDRNADAQRHPSEGPLAEPELRAFLIAKHEVTQAQWLRMTGRNPSSLRPGVRLDDDHEVTALHPVESLSWTSATRWLVRFGLQLPTEAQWEYAARGGTSSAWFTGSTAESLAGFANVADRHAAEDRLHRTSWQHEPWLDDGYTMHAPVGRYRANGFGLHDTVGNVFEWCREWWNDYRQTPRGGDGARTNFRGGYRIARGGSFSSLAVQGRSAARARFAPELEYQGIGVRPIRVLRPGGG